MRIPELNPAQKKWDKYKAFHWTFNGSEWAPHGLFVVFDTGEVIVTRSHFDRQEHLRKHHPDFDVSIYHTTDDKCPKLKTPDGVAIPKTHLQVGGAQSILIDHARKTVVGLTYAGGKDKPPAWASTIPSRFHGEAVCYWPGAGRVPVAGPITATRKRKLAEHETRHLAEIRSAIIARWEMDGTTAEMKEKFGMQRDKSLISGEWLLKQNFSDLTDEQQRRYYFSGRTDILETTVHPYLLLA